MTPPSRRIAITGATGLIGSALCRHLGTAGWAVHALSRRPSAMAAHVPNISRFTFDLSNAIDPASLSGCDAVIHAAYPTHEPNPRRAAQINEEGTRRLLDAARRAAVPRFIFISSMSAHPAARSAYARSKLLLEGLMDPQRDLVLRPGLVLALHAGLFSRLAAALRSAGIIPIPAARHALQTIHIDDLCRACSAALDRSLTGTLTVAAPEPTTLRDLIALTAARLGRRPWLIPIPAAPALLALRLAAAARLSIPATADNLLGLLSLRTADTRPDLARLGLEVRSSAESLNDLLSNASDSGTGVSPVSNPGG